jgi:hypothetical protein
MDEIILQPENTPETGESRSSEKQSLDEATFDPRAHVERSGNYKQSETIQAAFEAVAPKQKDEAADVGATPLPIPKPEAEARLAVEQDESLAGQQPKASEGPFEKASDEGGDDGKDATPINLPDVQEANDQGISAPIEQGKVITDPLTGKSFGDQGSTSPGETENPVALEPQAEKTGQDGTFEAQAPKIDDEEAGQLQASTGKVGMDDEQIRSIPGPGKLIPEDMPLDKKDFIGQGTHGMLDGSGPAKNFPGHIQGYGPGAGHPSHDTKVPGADIKNPLGQYTHGGSSSGGGPAVHGYGPGTKSEGQTYNYEGDPEEKKSESKFYGKFEGQAGSDCHSTVNHKTGDLTLTCKTKEGDTHIYHWSNTIDGGNPTPYTGSGTGGEKPQPQVIGGLDAESGHFNAVVSIGGKTVGGGGGNEPGTEDDEGHWYGGIFASAGRPNDPDNPDYYTPNVLDEADKAKKTSKSGG